jgi:hypothetical protein
MGNATLKEDESGPPLTPSSLLHPEAYLAALHTPLMDMIGVN